MHRAMKTARILCSILVCALLLGALWLPAGAADAPKIGDQEIKDLEIDLLTSFIDGKCVLNGQDLKGNTTELVGIAMSRGGKYAILAFNGSNAASIYRLNVDTMAVTATATIGKAVTSVATDEQSRVYVSTKDEIIVLKLSDMTEAGKTVVTGTDKLATESIGGATTVYALSGTELKAYTVGNDGTLSEKAGYGFNFTSAAASGTEGDQIRVKQITDIAACGGYVYATCDAAAGTGRGAVLILDKEGKKYTGGLVTAETALALTVSGDYVFAVTKDKKLISADKDTLEVVSETAFKSPTNDFTGVDVADDYLMLTATDRNGVSYLFEGALTFDAYSRVRAGIEKLGRYSFDSCDTIDYWNLVQCAQHLDIQDRLFVEGKGAAYCKMGNGNLVMSSCRSSRFGNAPLSSAADSNQLSMCVYVGPMANGITQMNVVLELASGSDGNPDSAGESQWIATLHTGWNLIWARARANTDMAVVDFVRMYNVDMSAIVPEDGLEIAIDDIALTKGPEGVNLEDDGVDRAADPLDSQRTKRGTSYTDYVIETPDPGESESQEPQETDETKGLEETNKTESGSSETNKPGSAETDGSGKKAGCGSVISGGVLVLAAVMCAGWVVRKKND